MNLDNLMDIARELRFSEAPLTAERNLRVALEQIIASAVANEREDCAVICDNGLLAHTCAIAIRKRAAA